MSEGQDGDNGGCYGCAAMILAVALAYAVIIIANAYARSHP